MMTRPQLRARLREALGPQRPRTGKRGRNVVESIATDRLLQMIRDGDAIVVSREVAELIIEQLARPVKAGAKD